jgi:hypothetical protein
MPMIGADNPNHPEHKKWLRDRNLEDKIKLPDEGNEKIVGEETDKEATGGKEVSEGKKKRGRPRKAD